MVSSSKMLDNSFLILYFVGNLREFLNTEGNKVEPAVPWLQISLERDWQAFGPGQEPLAGVKGKELLSSEFLGCGYVQDVKAPVTTGESVNGGEAEDIGQIADLNSDTARPPVGHVEGPVFCSLTGREALAGLGKAESIGQFELGQGRDGEGSRIGLNPVQCSLAVDVVAKKGEEEAGIGADYHGPPESLSNCPDSSALRQTS